MAEIKGVSPIERNGYCYPLLKTNLSPIPEDYTGHVVISDIDNTYLHTVYKKFSDFIRLAIEAPHDKKPVYGAPSLFRGLRLGADTPVKQRVPMYFVSASPESMRAKLERRFLLDEVDFDGASFRNLWSDRTPNLRHIKEIFGYKIAALLSYRLEQPWPHKQLLFGDSLEYDREIYVLYSRICAGSIRGAELDKVLEHRGVLDKDRQYIVQIASELPDYDPVERIYIRAVAHQSKELTKAIFDDSDTRVIVFDNYFEAAVWLASEHKIGSSVIAQVGLEIVATQKKLDWFEKSVKCLQNSKIENLNELLSPELLLELRSQLTAVHKRRQPRESDFGFCEHKAHEHNHQGEKEMTDSSSTEASAEKPEDSREAKKTAVEDKDEIAFEDFMKLDLKVATVKTCEIVKGADRLLKLELDVAHERRTVVSGIRAFYSVEDMVGKQVIYLANLRPRKLRGIVSQGMVLAATDDDQVKLLGVDSPCQSGAQVS